MFMVALLAFASSGCEDGSEGSALALDPADEVPASIASIMGEPRYEGAVWAINVVDRDSGQVLVELNSEESLFIGSVRKLFSVGALLDQVGAAHTTNTPIYRVGDVDGAGVLHGDLVLVATGDLTMGGRTLPDGAIAFTDFDHNEANSLGNAILSAPDPLAGYRRLAEEVASSGIRRVEGDVLIDGRLWKPYRFRNEFDMSPVFVNDDCIDVSITPVSAQRPVPLTYRPHSAAFMVSSDLDAVGPGEAFSVELEPELVECIGEAGCEGKVSGQIPSDLVPPLTGAPPLVRTFRIAKPENYARTVLIEALAEAGVEVTAPLVASNAALRLPERDSYEAESRVASLESLEEAQHAKLVLKVSYNLGAEASLILYGLENGVDSLEGALDVEREALLASYGISGDDIEFEDGSGGGETRARSSAIIRYLLGITESPAFSAFEDALPLLGADGSLATIDEFERDESLAGALGNVRAKTGTLLIAEGDQFVLRGEAFAGYIDASSGRKLAYSVVVNDAPPTDDLEGVLRIIQDLGIISATLWREF
jgi:D-alanyl-D-alanine carboxypeptidase/D-alanyl-D-alanine-endopeptidase (penicillin-binding protein 4)